MLKRTLLISLLWFNTLYGQPNQCLSCHKGIEPIRDPQSKMMQEILKISVKAGYPGNDCIVCHGGNPDGKTFEDIHSGTVPYFRNNPGPKEFYPDPGSPWINEHTCGQCHMDLVRTQWTSLMMTEAGKIQGVLWGFGFGDYEHRYANYDVKSLPDSLQLGTQEFLEYMKKLALHEPQVFPDSMITPPSAPSVDAVKRNPKLAAFTYVRGECQRCHLGNQGRRVRGDFRGMGCSACHIPYSNEGLYEGNDPTIDKQEPGHPLVHRIQSTRECVVSVHGKQYSGIPIETCTTCHNRGRRIGVSYQGLMETSYSSPFMGHGEEQPPLHTKHYLHLVPDVHLTKGMLCQDCHTSLDVHSSGILVGTTQAAVEIECQDCHGTPDAYPWELPLGYGDEIASEVPAQGKPRGVTFSLPDFLKKGTVYPPHDGYLLTARGNPFGNVVKDGNEVIVFTASGKELRLKPLKLLAQQNLMNEAARVAMVNVTKHIDKMECYSCHAVWAPQCYGCHIKIDYSSSHTLTDWIAVGHDVDEHGLSADARGEKQKHAIQGHVIEQRSYLRWENPPLGINGEGRVSPLTTGCQTTITIIDDSGKAILLNYIFKLKDKEGRKEVLAIDMVPLHPHTVQKKARSCESCHVDPKAVGLGIEEGSLLWRPDSQYVVDLMTADGTIIPEKTRLQFAAIPALPYDWSRFLDSALEQFHTVGHHLSKSRAFTKSEILRIRRHGVCISCHRSIPSGNLAIALLYNFKEHIGLVIDHQVHDSLIHKITILSAWVQVLAPIVIVLATIVVIVIARKKYRSTKNSFN